MNSEIRDLLYEVRNRVDDGNWVDDGLLAQINTLIEGEDDYSVQSLHRNYYCYPGDSSGHFLAKARYINANGFATVIIASVRFRHSGALLDWAAYWGGCDRTQREEDAVRWVAAKGCKLPRSDAQHFFPGIPVVRYRQ